MRTLSGGPETASTTMGFLDRLFGRGRASPHRGFPQRRPPQAAPGRGASPPARPAASDADAQALERYQYLVRTAPPQALEQIHREAFSRLTPEQRRRALHELSAAVPPAERLTGDDPSSLARMATRAELMRPGTMVSALGSPGLGMGSVFAGSLLSSVMGGVMGSMLAHQLLGGFQGGLHGGDEQGYGQGDEAGHEAAQDDAQASEEQASEEQPGGADTAEVAGADVPTDDWLGGADDFGGGGDWGADLGDDGF